VTGQPPERPPQPSAPAGPPLPGAPAAAPPAAQRVRLPIHRVWATYALLGLITAVFLAQLASQQLTGTDWVLILGAKDNASIAHGEVWRLLTAIFIHIGLLHYGFNAYALYNIGREVEAFSGPLRMLLLFFFSGLAGTVFSLIFNRSPSVGASGAIFGLIGALGVFLYRHRRLFGERGRRGLQQVIFIALINFVIGLQGSIDNWGHLGGLLGGLALSAVVGPLWAVRLDPQLGGGPRAEDQRPLTPLRWAGVLLLSAGLAVLTGLGVFLAGR
jgi:rhomboid protease GluP